MRHVLCLCHGVMCVLCCCHVLLSACSVDVAMAFFQHHPFPPIPQPVRYQFSRVLMGWGGEGRGDILQFRLSFLIGTHSIDHACRCAIPIHRRWLSQRPLGMTASSPARPGVNPHTRWLHQRSRGTSMTADPPARPSVNPHTRWLHQLSLGMSMTADPPARPSVNAHIGWLHQLLHPPAAAPTPRPAPTAVAAVATVAAAHPASGRCAAIRRAPSHVTRGNAICTPRG